MANHKKATHHHGKAGDCLKKGDHKGAAHHMGHALSALRQAASDDDADDTGAAMIGDPEGHGYEPTPTGPSIRDRLKGFKK